MVFDCDVGIGIDVIVWLGDGGGCGGDGVVGRG